MNCPKCNYPAAPNQKFCENCGAPIAQVQIDVERTMAADVVPALLDSVKLGFIGRMERDGRIRFTGDKRWLNFRLEYTDGAEFPSFAKMIECMHRHSGYRNEFAGVVRIDMTDWTEHTEDARLASVIAFIHDYSDSVFFITTVTSDEKLMCEPLKKVFDKWIHTEFITVAKPSTEILTETVIDRLASEGHTLTADAKELIEASVRKLSEQKHFAGLREIISLADAISAEAVGVKRISAKHLSAFSSEGEWIAEHTDGESFSIGFSGGNSNDRE